MSSTLHQPSEVQLAAARRQRWIVNVLLSPDNSAQLISDPKARNGLRQLIDAGLVVARLDQRGDATSFRLTSCGLAAALRLLEDP